MCTVNAQEYTLSPDSIFSGVKAVSTYVAHQLQQDTAHGSPECLAADLPASLWCCLVDGRTWCGNG